MTMAIMMMTMRRMMYRSIHMISNLAHPVIGHYNRRQYRDRWIWSDDDDYGNDDNEEDDDDGDDRMIYHPIHIISNLVQISNELEV